MRKYLNAQEASKGGSIPSPAEMAYVSPGIPDKGHP